ncbi:MAG: histidinol-phosphate transaminase [Mariprofundaceae bacterium]
MLRPQVDWTARAVRQCGQLQAYAPGKPVEQLLREQGLSEAVKLASNENPFGPPPAAIEAIRQAASQVHRYPDGDGGKLKARLASKHGIEPSRILLGNGSNEVLELAIRTFAGPGDAVVYSEHAFIIYALAATAAGADGAAVPEADGLSHDLDAMQAAVDSRTKVVCIANPNNPTGSLHDLDTIQTFLDGLPTQVLVILDEAYYEYVADEIGDSLERLHHPGLFVCRTFSKAYGLAGCRIGYGVADSAIIGLMNRFREPFNVNHLALSAALAALDEDAWMKEKTAATLHERKRLEQFLYAHGCLAAASHGNFVLLRHARADELLPQLESRGMIPRPLTAYGMGDCLRISVGLKEENDMLMTMLADALDALNA